MKLIRTLTILTVLTIWAGALTYAHGQIVVENPSKTGPQQTSIYNTLDFIVANMDASCSATLPMAKDMIVALESDRSNEQTILIGHANFPNTTIAAFTNEGHEPAGYLVVIADNGAFFTANEKTEIAHLSGSTIGSVMGGDRTSFYIIAGQYKGGTNPAKVEILLHELGHAVNAPGFQADYNSQNKIDANDRIIMTGCKSVLKAAGKYKGVL